MSKTSGILNLSANFEPLIASPLDSRQIVTTKADLTASNTWNGYQYIGMTVTVTADGTNNGMWRLNAADYTSASNWIAVGAGVGGSTNFDGTISATSVVDTLTVQGPVTSTTLKTAIDNISLAASEFGQCGLLSWGSEVANHYTWTPGNPGTFTLNKSGVGYVRGKRVTWAAGQSVTIAYGERVLIYINASGILSKIASNYESVYNDAIRLFFGQNDHAGDSIFSRKDYKYTTDTGAVTLANNSLKTFLCDLVNCACISRYGTGTGESSNDRMINITAGEIIDGDIIEEWSDYTTGVGTISHVYLNNLGQFARYSASGAFPMVYSSNGVATSIPSGECGVFRLYAALSDYNNPTPQFIAELDTTKYSTSNEALAAIGHGTVSGIGLFSPEQAQLGFVVVQNNINGGQILTVKVSRKTASGYQGVAAGAAASADLVPTIPSGFSGILSTNTGSVQQALETLSLGAAPNVSSLTLDSTGFTDPDNITVTYNSSNSTVTMTHASGKIKYLWRDTVAELTSPWTSSAHGTNAANYYLSSTNGTNFTWSTNIWSFSDMQVATVGYTAGGRIGNRECHGVMPYTVHRDNHFGVGTLRIAGGTLENYTLNSYTATNRRPTITATSVLDEDLLTVNAALTTNSYNVTYLSGTVSGTNEGTLNFTTNATEFINLTTTRPNVNVLTSGTAVMTPITGGRFMSMWLVAIPTTSDAGSQAYRYIWLQGQTQSTALATEQAIASTSLDTRRFQTIFNEFTFIAQVVVEYVGGAANWRIAYAAALSGSRAAQVAQAVTGLISVESDSNFFTGVGTAVSPLGITSNVTTASNLGPQIASLTEKTSLIDTDMVPMMDAASSNETKKVSAATLLKPLDTNIRGTTAGNLLQVGTNSNATIVETSPRNLIAGLTEKTAPLVSNDTVMILDSADATYAKKATMATLSSSVGETLGALIAAATAKSTPISADSIAICDSAASNATKELTLGELSTFVRTGLTVAPSAGQIGETFEQTNSVTNIGTNYGTVGTYTVTNAGVYSISGGLFVNPSVTNTTAVYGKLDTKGVAGSVNGKDLTQANTPSGGNASLCFPSRTITITAAEVTGGSNTITVQSKTLGATNTCTASSFISVTRIA